MRELAMKCSLMIQVLVCVLISLGVLIPQQSFAQG